MASSKETYCLCGQPYNIGQFMIECDCCREWFHGSCVDVKVYHSDDIDKYHCPKCSQTYGPSVFKIPTNNHRADRYELGAETHPSQVGTPAWVRALAARPLRPTNAALQRMRPHHFTEEFVRDNGFTRPIIFLTAEGLEIKVPNPATFTVRSVLRFCGAQLEVEVIDVRKQVTLRMPLGDFVDYFETPPEHRDEKVLNVLSLEFSDTNMSGLVEPPALARQLDWCRAAWPAAEERPPRPAVQKYCLISAAGSYTDFHLDFGGTTVWYHVLHGRKIFYLIPPTSTNLALYQQWCNSNNQSERFFGDMVEWYGTAELSAGQTLFIPSGWIHAVLTPCDTLVFGGNLLHSYAIEMQLQVYEIERRVETPTMLRYPLFEAMHWYAGAHLLTMLRRHNEETQDEDFTISESVVQSAPLQLPPLLLRGIKILANALKEWHALKSTDSAKRDNVPKCLNSGQLVRELCKELRTLEKRSSANKDKNVLSSSLESGIVRLTSKGSPPIITLNSNVTGKSWVTCIRNPSGFKRRDVTYLYKDYKVKSQMSPSKHAKKQSSSSKKSLKLTLPKPIMHMGQEKKLAEEKIYADKFYIDNKEVHPDRFIQSDIKYTNGVTDKYAVDQKDIVLQEKFVYQTYEDVQGYQDGLNYVDRNDKKNVLKIKLNNSPSSSREEAPPPYPLQEHSILKSHLIRSDRPTLKPIHQWTISKKDIGDYQEEQILFTNENLQANVRVEGHDLNYGPGMYSAEDIQQDYQYSETAKPGCYQPEYGYQQISYTVENYQRYEEVQPTPAVHQSASYTNIPVQEQLNGTYHQNQLPSYDAAIAHQHYGPTNTDFVIEEEKPSTNGLSVGSGQQVVGGVAGTGAVGGAGAAAVRRSVRPVRRRVSTTYDYEDCDLYIDDAPPPPRKHRHRHSNNNYRHSAASNTSNSTSSYRQSASRPAPANGIESLIQASVLAEEEPGNSTEDAAVAGMLSIGEQRFSAPHRTFGLALDAPLPAPPAATTSTTSAAISTSTSANRHDSGTPTSGKRTRKPAAVVSSAEEDFADEQDVIKEVHRDEEYVYPSLEMSSDEDEEWTETRRQRSSRNRVDSKSKGDKDESWSPRARLGRLVPRVRTSARAGVRRECVRAALHAASRRHPRAPNAAPAPAPAPAAGPAPSAASTTAVASQHAHAHAPARPAPADPAHRAHVPPNHPQSAKRAVLATKSRRPPPPAQTTPNKNIRLKKGMKTAKQRLGKILKIHKMIY